MRRPVRVMLVDDSIVVRSIIERIVDTADGFEVVASVPGGADALDVLDQQIVDIVVLDLEMPGMNGLSALPLILQRSAGARVIILSANCDEGGPAAIAALALGACDTLIKPGRGTFAGKFGDTLIERLRALATMKPPTVAADSQRSLVSIVPPALPSMADGLAAIGIGASTGGIMAINTLLGALSDAVHCPIFITQHLPVGFIPYFAEQLQRSSERRVRVAQDGELVADDCIYLAPGDAHLGLTGTSGAVRIALDRMPAASGAWPSVDPMMAALGAMYGPMACGIMLSGMGRDGCDGARQLREAGGLMLAQDMESSVVWGMPGAVAASGIAHGLLNPAMLAAAIGDAARGAERAR